MMLLSLSFILTIIFKISLATEGELKFVIVIYRHGDRSPTFTYPNDTIATLSNWPEGLGQLTRRGIWMQYGLGQFLRERYGSFLGEKYNKDLIYVRSTDYDRTLMSAESNLAGLFPPSGDQLWNPKIPWQPIPIHTLPTKEDHLLASSPTCPRRAQLLKEVLASPEIKSLNNQSEWLYQYLSVNTQTNITDIDTLMDLYDNLHIGALYNLSLPAWSKDVFPEKMQHLFDFGFTLKTRNDEMKRLSAGPLIANIVDLMTNVTKHVDKRKMIMYSGHDTTIANLLNSLGMYDPPIAPPYASMLITELRSLNNQSFISFEYRNDTLKDPYQLSIPGCQSPCKLEDFDAITKQLRPQNRSEDCRSKSDMVG